jgi:hypothetical protein
VGNGASSSTCAYNNNVVTLHCILFGAMIGVEVEDICQGCDNGFVKVVWVGKNKIDHFIVVMKIMIISSSCIILKNYKLYFNE